MISVEAPSEEINEVMKTSFTTVVIFITIQLTGHGLVFQFPGVCRVDRLVAR